MRKLAFITLLLAMSVIILAVVYTGVTTFILFDRTTPVASNPATPPSTPPPPPPPPPPSSTTTGSGTGPSGSGSGNSNGGSGQSPTTPTPQSPPPPPFLQSSTVGCPSYVISDPYCTAERYYEVQHMFNNDHFTTTIYPALKRENVLNGQLALVLTNALADNATLASISVSIDYKLPNMIRWKSITAATSIPNSKCNGIARVCGVAAFGARPPSELKITPSNFHEIVIEPSSVPGEALCEENTTIYVDYTLLVDPYRAAILANPLAERRLVLAATYRSLGTSPTSEQRCALDVTCDGRSDDLDRRSYTTFSYFDVDMINFSTLGTSCEVSTCDCYKVEVTLDVDRYNNALVGTLAVEDIIHNSSQTLDDVLPEPAPLQVYSGCFGRIPSDNTVDGLLVAVYETWPSNLLVWPSERHLNVSGFYVSNASWNRLVSFEEESCQAVSSISYEPKSVTGAFAMPFNIPEEVPVPSPVPSSSPEEEVDVPSPTHNEEPVPEPEAVVPEPSPSTVIDEEEEEDTPAPSTIEEPPECITDSDCNDNLSCTTNECILNVCVYTPVVCTTTENCLVAYCDEENAGACATRPLECNNGPPCTTGVCSPSTGECVYMPDEDC